MASSLTPDQLKRKWDNLLRKYKDLKNPKTGSGTQGEETPITWPFWEAMDLAVGQRDIINPPELFCSSKGLQVRSGSASASCSWEADEESASSTSHQSSSSSSPPEHVGRGKKRKLEEENVFTETSKKIQVALEVFQRQGDRLNDLLEKLLEK
uniref:Myb/SANT-like DNA-binding domain-containing protein n=1 Tax=Timema shepardi TaxID=629360 RepID=A0A7R9B9L5_TIMSH|nr:unnamed protein product [Timema shepardi]